MNSIKRKGKKSKKKHDKKHKKDKKRRRRSSSSSSSSDSSSTTASSSSSSSDEKTKKYRKKHKKDRKRKRAERKLPDTGNGLPKAGESSQAVCTQASEEDFSIPLKLMDSKAKAPETKEEYEKRQSIIRRVVDEETGRTRLIKGDGEIIEEMVTRDRHREINKLATKSDGQIYSNKMMGWAANSNNSK